MEKTTINIQPNWISMLPMMLVLNTQFDTSIKSKKIKPQDDTNRDQIREEFKKMAIAADKWNAHCKSINKTN